MAVQSASKLVKQMIREANVSEKWVANQLAMKPGTFYEKMRNNRFKAHELMSIAELTGHVISAEPKHKRRVR